MCRFEGDLYGLFEKISILTGDDIKKNIELMNDCSD